MSSLELTKKIELLSQEDFDMIVSLVNRLAEKDVAFKYMTEEDFVEELTESIKVSDAGNVKSARAVSENMRNKYAL